MKLILTVMSLGLLIFSTAETAQAIPFGRDRVEKMMAREDGNRSDMREFFSRLEKGEFLRPQAQEHINQFVSNLGRRIERSESRLNLGDYSPRNYSSSNNHSNNSTPSPVPEPATILLLASGLAVLGLKSKKSFLKKK